MDHEVTGATGSRDTVTDLGPLKALVLAAYEQARAGGRPDWRVMTPGVLKNRLLQLTSREFNEAQYGAESFHDLLGLIPDLLQVDYTKRPPLVTLIDGPSPPTDPSRPGGGRVRSDLWHGVVDYSADGVYVWDGTRAVLVPEASEGVTVLPTLTADGFAAWRREFADRVGGETLADWAERALGTIALPPHLRAPWNDFVKIRVLDVLRGWFGEHSIEPPADLLIPSTGSPTMGGSTNNETEDLRRYVQRCIAIMKPHELRALQIPAAVALRVKI